MKQALFCVYVLHRLTLWRQRSCNASGVRSLHCWLSQHGVLHIPCGTVPILCLTLLCMYGPHVVEWAMSHWILHTTQPRWLCMQSVPAVLLHLLLLALLQTCICCAQRWVDAQQVLYSGITSLVMQNRPQLVTNTEHALVAKLIARVQV